MMDPEDHQIMSSNSSNLQKNDFALKVIDLCKSFRSGFLCRPIRGIEGVSFSIPRGRIFALLGHNGAGKTTTINCILDLVKPDQGQVNILGHDHGNRSVRGRVGYLPERPYFFEHLSGRELLHFYSKLLGVEKQIRDTRIEELVGRMGLGAFIDRKLKKYSKGMLQRIGIAQALLGDPDLLILDEPMSGLDPLGRREIRELILELKARGKTILLSSHIVPDIEQMADTVGILRDGKMVMTKNLADMESNATFEIIMGDKERAIARNVEDLEALLEKSRLNNKTISRIQTSSSSLEDLYLAAHNIKEEVR